MLTTVVVFPTPPFWFAQATISPTDHPYHSSHTAVMVPRTAPPVPERTTRYPRCDRQPGVGAIYAVPGCDRAHVASPTAMRVRPCLHASQWLIPEVIHSPRVVARGIVSRGTSTTDRWTRAGDAPHTGRVGPAGRQCRFVHSAPTLTTDVVEHPRASSGASGRPDIATSDSSPGSRFRNAAVFHVERDRSDTPGQADMLSTAGGSGPRPHSRRDARGGARRDRALRHRGERHLHRPRRRDGGELVYTAGGEAQRDG